MGKEKSKPFLKFHSVTFSYDSSPGPLFKDISMHAVPGWSGVIGANGAGKTTLLKLAAGLLDPVAGSIDAPRDTFYCPQRTDDIPGNLNELIFSSSKSAQILKSRLSIGHDWPDARRWSTLSHGERKRAQIAVALWLEPGVLAVDEPTNHVDAEARHMIMDAFRSFNGVGLLVSHDRELLDSLCYQCLFLDPPGVILRRGGYSQGVIEIKKEQAYILKQRMVKKQAYKKLKKETSRRKALAAQSDKRRSKRGLAVKDHDARAKKDLARVTGKDGVGGKLKRQLQGRLTQAQKDLEKITVKKQYNLGIWLPASFSRRDFLLALPAGSLPMGEQKQLHYPELVLKPDDRIAVTGPNGSGKSTLIRYIVDSLNVPEEHVTYVPQEIDAHRSQEILNQVRRISKDKLGHLMTVISRLGSRPHRLLDSVDPSPGETRKLLLAVGMTREPHIIIMDEPTNHMDLPSIECLEQALTECPCCLVLVSHDNMFLRKLTHNHWNIRKELPASSYGNYVMHLME